jgi:hypothetical protein
MRATSQDEFGGPEVLKCLGDPRLVSPRVPNPTERSAAATGTPIAPPLDAHAQGSAGPMQKVRGFESLQPLPGTEYLNV